VLPSSLTICSLLKFLLLEHLQRWSELLLGILALLGYPFVSVAPVRRNTNPFRYARIGVTYFACYMFIAEISITRVFATVE
jgi:hypothetical protein